MLVIVADSLRHRSGILGRGTTSSEKPNLVEFKKKPNLVEFKKNQIWLNSKKNKLG